MTTSIHIRLGWRFWTKWVSANALAITVSVSIFYVGGIILAGGVFGGGALLLIIVGIPAVVGKVQSLILDKFVDWHGWTGVTIGGWALGCLIILFILTTQRIDDSGILSAAILGSLLGITVGAAQWSIMNQHVQKSGWWIAANIAAISLSVSIGNVIASVFYEPSTSRLPEIDFWKSLSGGGILASIIVASIIFSAITGVVLTWLLAHQR